MLTNDNKSNQLITIVDDNDNENEKDTDTVNDIDNDNVKVNDAPYSFSKKTVCVCNEQVLALQEQLP